MTLFDSHCHLDTAAFPEEGEVAAVAARARAAGVAHLLVVGAGYGFASAERAIAAMDLLPGAWCSVGLHPHDAAEWTAARGEALLALAAHPRVVALGEMGLDFHYDHSPRDTQRAVLRWQVQAGRRLGLPLIVHDRETGGETFRILLEEGGFSGPSLVYHCFSGTVGEMEEIVAAGGYISIPGIVTFKKSDEMREVARRVPLDRLLIETDSPFLAPVPHRGRKNEPAFVRHVAECIAGLRGMDTAALAAATTANAFRFFRLPAVG